MRAALVASLIVLGTPVPALAGRLIATGHDADRRCIQLGQQCNFLKVAIKYVRESSPAQKKPILVLDRGPRQLAASIRKAWRGSGYASLAAAAPPLEVVDPRSAAFKKLTIDAKHFSVIAIASDESCGGCDLQAPDEAALWSRRAVLQKFLSAGGGMYVGAGGTNAAYYYRFMPLPAPGPGDAGPFQLTPYGKAIGFSATDISDAVANTFANPDVGRMDVAAKSANNVGDTLIADGKVAGGQLVATTTIPPALGQSIVVQPVTGIVLGHPPNDPNFRRIVGAANLVSGWTFDVTKGRVALTTAANTRGSTQTVQAFEGFFTALQSPGSPVTDLVLRSGNFDAICGSGGVDIARTSQTNTTSVRHLWAKGSGKFRTKARFASAIVRGTEWETDDRCDGTLVTVKVGAVAVFDQTLQKTVVVTAGHSYLAKAP